jgi:hypothetical protein
MLFPSLAFSRGYSIAPLPCTQCVRNRFLRLKLVSSEELDEVRHRLQIPLGTDLKYQQSRYQANAETMKGKATFEWRNGNKYWIEPKGYNKLL